MENKNKIPTMLTIKEISKLTGLADYNIRQLCQKNEITYIKAGNKYLVNLEKFVDFLNGVA